MVNHKAGQSLLVLVMVIAVLMTIVASASYRLTVETQSTKLQEESIRALAAADSGIERGLKLANNAGASSVQTFANMNLQLAGVDSTKSRVLITQVSSTSFVSQDVVKDEQYVFYLTNYPDFTTFYNGTISMYFGSNSVSCTASPRTAPALELTLIYGQNTDQVAKYVLEPCTTGSIVSGTGKVQPLAQSRTISGQSFSYHTESSPLNISNSGIFRNPKMLIVRVLFAGTKLGFSSSTVLPAQGRTIRSEAVVYSGPSKIIEVFQSFPQIPADFFVTSF